MRLFISSVAALTIAAGANAQVLDGQLDAVYGAPLSVQNTQTEFGNSNLGVANWANGSELNAVYCRSDANNLYLMFTGNLESNWNKFELFLDTRSGGQNQLRGDNPNVDFNGLNRMGNDGSGNGLRFDAGFEADYFITVTGGDVGGGNWNFFANYAEILTGGGGSGQFLGGAGTGGTIVGGNGISIALNNSNTAGVGGGNGLDNGLNGAPIFGIEMCIPLAAIGNPSIAGMKGVAFINGGGHDYMSNQVLGGLGGMGNLAEPRNVNFANIAGDQFFRIPSPGSLALLGLGALVARRRR
ncbi:MAG: hypothetical protein HUU18_00570 [Phycisphaerales bacterium]|nr:hypothetical protein [Phycisphaerales bacterium]